MKMKKPKFLSEAEERLKKISDILRDKSAVAFTLSVSVYRDDLNEPRTFAMR